VQGVPASEYVPAGQFEQDDEEEPSLFDLPAGQFVQAAAPAEVVYRPIGHATQPLPPNEYLPAGQMKQEPELVLPAGLPCPFGQAMHFSVLTDVEYLPAGHCTHVVLKQNDPCIQHTSHTFKLSENWLVKLLTYLHCKWQCMRNHQQTPALWPLAV
jgi:hypothetical protein